MSAAATPTAGAPMDEVCPLPSPDRLGETRRAAPVRRTVARRRDERPWSEHSVRATVGRMVASRAVVDDAR